MTYFLKNVKQGLERETIRIDKRGQIAATRHPRALGAPLTHPHITLDFAEAQIEFITPPLQRGPSVQDFAEKLIVWTSRNIGTELLWPFSMPPKLPMHERIGLAHFGASADAERKHIYREGLMQRYGGAVQTISGIHYNFSLDDSFWKSYAKEKRITGLPAMPAHAGQAGDLSLFKDESYFALMRNIIRYVPIITYLFGASPAADKSFFRDPPAALKKMGPSTYVGPWATSLRQSSFGYNNLSNQVSVSFNSLDEYLNDLYRAITTPSKLWSSIGLRKGSKQLQLNANILQIENEFYGAVRPKQKHDVHGSGSPIASLACAGVEYVELRSIDIDPYEPAGIGLPQLRFLQAFMTYCLLADSPHFKRGLPAQAGEQKKWEANQMLVALDGRKPDLAIYSGSKKEKFADWSLRHLNGIARIAAMLDKEYECDDYSRAVEMQKEKILAPNKTPSARLLSEIGKSGKSYVEFGLAMAKKYKHSPIPINPDYNQKMKEIGRKSLSDLARLEVREKWIMKGYEGLELSTQVLIRAALERNIAVEVLDDELNVVELSKGGKKEIVKQATITKKDSYLSYELMNDKTLTKSFLSQAGLSTPRGGRFAEKSEALIFCHKHRLSALVVKPAKANYGIGISVLKAKVDDRTYTNAIREAFRHDSMILIEEFIPGKEYRFLVVDGKVVAVLNRDPANVIGDGKRTIKELVVEKNTYPASFKLPDSYIQQGRTEREALSESGLSFDSIPPRGRKIYLRKNSNVHTGGDPLAIDNMPLYYKNIAIKAALNVGAKICGVDMMIKKFKAKPGKSNYSIIELNWNPAIFMHAYPYKGKPKDVGGTILDFLGF